MFHNFSNWVKAAARSPLARNRFGRIVKAAAVGGVLQLGVFHVEQYESPGGLLVAKFRITNAATTEGLNYLLGAGFKGASATSTWYLGLINGSGYTAVAAADTMSSHAGWTENTAYSQSTRPTWSAGTVASASLPTSSASAYTVNADGTVRGIFVTSNSTKSGTTGTLWATAVEASNRSVTNGQSLQVYYTNSLTAVS